MENNLLSIESTTKVAELLDCYPELEDVLIDIAPPFKKLKNPVLRKSVAKVASLKQAAAVAGMSSDDLVNRLRAAVGQDAVSSETAHESVVYFADKPAWFDQSRIVESINEQSDLTENTMPLTIVLQKAKNLEGADILELVTSFLPAPGIDIMKKKGFSVWSEQETPDLIKTYFARSAEAVIQQEKRH